MAAVDAALVVAVGGAMGTDGDRADFCPVMGHNAVAGQNGGRC